MALDQGEVEQLVTEVRSTIKDFNFECEVCLLIQLIGNITDNLEMSEMRNGLELIDIPRLKGAERGHFCVHDSYRK